MIKKVITVTLILAFALFAAGCGATEQAEGQNTEQAISESETQGETTEMKLFIGEEEVNVEWEKNDAVAALGEMVQKQPLTVDMSMYDDFEQVGELGMSLPAEDEQITTESGDIMLYSGDKIVVFYGSNSWDYTPLGKVTNKSPEEMAELLGAGDVTITIQ